MRPARVLVVDDDRVLGNAFRMTLSRDFDVRVVSSGAEALQVLADDGTFDFIFCDLMMPEMSGMDVFGELSRRQPEVAAKVLFMTGGIFRRRCGPSSHACRTAACKSRSIRRS